ncbi:hypothetical protein [Rhodovulum sp. YEN HP10]|uniref:hypothetical protein n=1 Tax=Rhodovulum sp. HP10 TaxID=3387397 RepID=UPI0039DFD2C8
MMPFDAIVSVTGKVRFGEGHAMHGGGLEGPLPADIVEKHPLRPRSHLGLERCSALGPQMTFYKSGSRKSRTVSHEMALPGCSSEFFNGIRPEHPGALAVDTVEKRVFVAAEYRLIGNHSDFRRYRLLSGPLFTL